LNVSHRRPARYTVDGQKRQWRGDGRRRPL
jgi:hypothetical protein